MKQIVLDKLAQLTEKFAKDLLFIEDATLRREKDKEDEIQELVEQQKNLKEQEKNNERSLQVHKAKLTEAIESQKQSINDLNIEMSRYTKLCNEVTLNERATKEALSIANDIKKETTSELERQMKKTRDLQDKLDLLRQDDELIAKKKRELEERERGIITKEKVNLRNEKRNIDREHELDEIALDVKIKEKKIVLEYKRLKLG